MLSTWTGDCLWADKPSGYVTRHLLWLSLPASVGRKNGFQLSGWVIVNGNGGCSCLQAGQWLKSMPPWASGLGPRVGVSAYTGWVIINGNGGCSYVSADRRVNGSSPWAWCKGRRPSGAVLHSLHDPGVRCPCSDLMDMLRRLMNCRIIIIIIIIITIIAERTQSVLMTSNYRGLYAPMGSAARSKGP